MREPDDVLLTDLRRLASAVDPAPPDLLDTVRRANEKHDETEALDADRSTR